ncbi:isoprenylcysteine carboxylmethyltransferase family protein [bacterium]|nr:isoprenylcysteine carboxylmethyltransferase family protein [bacterium]
MAVKLYSQWVRRHRRNLGIPLVVAALLLARYEPRVLGFSIALVVAGEAIRIWAAGHLRKEQLLTTGGPYRIIRNPLYLGSFLIAVGFCLVANSVWIWLLVAAYFALCYVPVIRHEESVLRGKFPGEFSQYSADVPALYPTIRLYPNISTQFSWQQVLRNKEYNAVLGILVGYAYLVLIASKLS